VLFVFIVGSYDFSGGCPLVGKRGCTALLCKGRAEEPSQTWENSEPGFATRDGLR
jgi:hypothetical protein